MGINPLECNLIGNDAFREVFALLITLVRQEWTNPCDNVDIGALRQVNMKFDLDEFTTLSQSCLYVCIYSSRLARTSRLIISPRFERKFSEFEQNTNSDVATCRGGRSFRQNMYEFSTFTR